MLNLSLAVLFTCIFSNNVMVEGHSWLSCPPSFNTNPLRGGHLQPVCEPLSARAPTTYVKAGDRLKLGWPSNNHGGGFVRISLVPVSQYQDEAVALKNVLKFACYGHDTRPSRTRYGDCKHPCDARGGCDYPRDIKDMERYDTTVGIPTNLKDGIYILQTAMLVGNSYSVYYSCAKLSISGGNPSFNCKSDEAPITYPCLKSAGPNIKGHKLHTGAKRGDFCFHKDGTRGTVDDNYSQVPVNRNCDPRITCGLGVSSLAQCNADAPTMKNIAFSPTTKEPIQKSCSAVGVPVTPSISKTNGNTGNEGIATTTEAPKKDNKLTKEEGLLFNDERPIIVRADVLADEALYKFQLTFNKIVTQEHCWQLFLQFKNPFYLNEDDAYAVWDQGMLVARPAPRTMIVQQRPWTQAKPGIKVAASMKLFRGGGEPWNDDNMGRITSLLEVKPRSECYTEVFLDQRDKHVFSDQQYYNKAVAWRFSGVLCLLCIANSVISAFL